MSGYQKPTLEIADIFNEHSDLLGSMPKQIWKVVQAIKNCRTDALGGHLMKCDSCDFKKNAYNSCRNRHCPKCQFLARSKWIEAREADLLPCSYFHVVFTIPAELKPVFLQNKKECYDILFKAASATIKEVAANEKHLGAETGSIGVLHTWAQNLMDHPHVHFIVPAGGLSEDKSRWIASRKDFFVPVRVLSKVFRGKLLSLLRAACDEGTLSFFGEIEYLSSPQFFDELMFTCAAKEFVVYAKKPFAGPKAVISYLGQYTHRIAISNYRLVALDGDMVTFKVRDNDNPGEKKVMTLHVKEFMRRFLLHVLPKGFVRIRHFGFLSSRAKKAKIATIRALIGLANYLSGKAEKETWKELLLRKTGIDADRCPKCKIGFLIEVRSLYPFINSS
ncbi:MAG: IS91 family transposase [Oceanospirillales bacterium]|nr:MAG: IS91 family transposase [Oceanospirillales bacterium]